MVGRQVDQLAHGVEVEADHGNAVQAAATGGEHQGLGLIPGVMADLKEDIPANLKVPHMGWNSLHLTEKGKKHPLFKYSKEGDYVYFVHSFYGKDCDESLLATSEYGIPVTASAANENVMGCQFHPEKSGEVGLRILKAFSEI